MLGRTLVVRVRKRLAWTGGAVVAAVALSCTFSIETRSTQCANDADCAAFPHAACDGTQHLCVDQACAAGDCVRTPRTPDEILNACPKGDCHPFDNGRVPDAAAMGAGGAPAPTFACPGTGGGTGTGGGDGGAIVPVCEQLPSPLYLIGPGSIKPLFAWVAKLYAKYGVTVVFQNDSSCIGVKKMFLTTESMENDPGNEQWTTYYDPSGQEHPCKFVAGNVRPHIGLSDVFAQTCGYDTNVNDPHVVDTPGPVQAMGFSVPSDPRATETSISAEAARAIYEGAGVAPWTDERYVFQRSPSSGTQNMIGKVLGVDVNAFHATTSISSDDEASRVGCSPAPEKTLGILAVDLVESKAYPIRLLAYQHFKQSCGYLPDSTATANDKRHVRDGHDFIWGPAHLFTRNDEPNARATEMVSYVSGIIPPPTDQPVDIFQVWASAHLVPQCAMRVTRSSDGGPLAAYLPPTSCYCKYDEVTTGNAGCPTCKTSTDCPADKPACSPYGYCEPQ